MSTPFVITGGKAAKTEFEQFMLPYFDVLYRRAYRLTGNTDDAEDLIQDLYLRVFSRFGQVKNVHNPKTWLLRVLYRLFVDATRRNARNPLRSMQSTVDEDYSMAMACPKPGPEEDVDGILTHQRLRLALQYLQPEEQVLLIMHEVEGYSLPELEELTELPQGTLKSRLHRARVRLGRLLKRQEKGHRPDPGGISHELPGHRRSVG